MRIRTPPPRKLGGGVFLSPHIYQGRERVHTDHLQCPGCRLPVAIGAVGVAIVDLSTFLLTCPFCGFSSTVHGEIQSVRFVPHPR